ncbi:MAG: type ISP restriction/modification enzyme, partial [Planctomycetota bacterium]
VRTPFENFLRSAGPIFQTHIEPTGESAVAGLGKPDFAIYTDGVLTGHAELKKVGDGARTSQFRGRNREQWERFKALPNLVYCDGNEWALYRDGVLVGALVKFDGDVVEDGPAAVSDAVARKLKALLTDFLNWEPIVPRQPRELAEQLAPRCRLLRDQVQDALARSGSPLVQLKTDWQALLFPGANDQQFADAYAQTVTFALLLARAEGWQSDRLDDAVRSLGTHYGVMARALRVLTEPDATVGIETALSVLRRIIGALNPEVFRPRHEQLRLIEEVNLRPADAWLYFYEDFLAAYDHNMRRDAGVYYTPVEVVRLQVRLIDELLRQKLRRPLGFADPGVTTLDPAAGTGSYLLAVIDQALGNDRDSQGPGAVKPAATRLARQICGFEKLPGPYSVAELRVSQALERFKAEIPDGGLNILLTDTLESPEGAAAHTPLYMRVIADQHQRALTVKRSTPIIVCLGNPPYDRHAASRDPADRAATGGWVRWGGGPDAPQALLEDFARPAREAGHGGGLKNLYNLYVYFWRWALWKTFQCTSDGSGGPDGPGIVSFISASSFLRGDAFVGLRRMLREECDEIWVIDLGGEGRGTRKEDNVFAIQTPVCITIGVRAGAIERAKPAKVHYSRMRGTRAEKLAALDRVRSLRHVHGAAAPRDFDAPLIPGRAGDYFRWRELRDIFPWQHSGCELKRSWPIAPEPSVLEQRWRRLLSDGVRPAAFVQTRDRHSDSRVSDLASGESLTPLDHLPSTAPCERIERYAFRAFDRQWLIADSRVADYARPVLWRAHSNAQLYLSTLFNHPVGTGPALVASALVPDRHLFRGSYGGRDVLPLYRDASAARPNLCQCLGRTLRETIRMRPTPEDIAAYVYAVLGHPAYTERFWDELDTLEVRVPITKDVRLFRCAVVLGRRLLWLHTYGERLVPRGRTTGDVRAGAARCLEAVPDRADEYPESFTYDPAAREIRVGGNDLFRQPAGRFGSVAPEVWGFEVSGLKVVQSWLGYRMRVRKGRRSSPLDDIHSERWTHEFTSEFLKLLWILEHTLACYPAQADLLERICAGPLFAATDFPEPAPELRRAPTGGADKQNHFDFDSEEPDD